MNKILLTGGAGFIGSNISRALIDDGYEVVICDYFGEDNKWKNVAAHNVADIIAPEEMFYWLQENAATTLAIIHMGAISSTTETNVDAALGTNFALSKALYHFAAENGLRFIYASSAATYGDGTHGFKDDESLDYLGSIKPLNPYGFSKHVFDKYVVQQQKILAPKQCVGLKFFNVYGPNEEHKESQKSVVSQFFKQINEGSKAKLFKSYRDDVENGAQKRDFVYVKDCVEVVKWFLKNEGASGIFNLGTGTARTFEEMAEAIFATLGKEKNVEYISMPLEIRSQYQYFTEADMSKLKDAGCDVKFHTLEDGVKDYIENFLSKDDIYN